MGLFKKREKKNKNQTKTKTRKKCKKYNDKKCSFRTTRNATKARYHLNGSTISVVEGKRTTTILIIPAIHKHIPAIPFLAVTTEYIPRDISLCGSTSVCGKSVHGCIRKSTGTEGVKENKIDIILMSVLFSVTDTIIHNTRYL